jgi:hypothetical protein
MSLVEHRDQVTDVDVLVLLDDAVGASLACVVDEVVRVEAASSVAELCDPRPDVL